MINTFITSILSNPALSLFILGSVVSILILIFKKKPRGPGTAIEILFSYFLLFSVGINYYHLI